MIAFAGMLIGAAQEAGMKVPPNVDAFDQGEYPHFTVFCNAQLGAPMETPVIHFENAKVIASIPEEKITKVTFDDLNRLGFSTGYSLP